MSDGGISPVDLDAAGDDGPDAPEHGHGAEEHEAEDYSPRYGAKGLFHTSDNSSALLRPTFFRPPNSAQSSVKDEGRGSRGISNTLATESSISWLVRTTFTSSASLTSTSNAEKTEKADEDNIYERWWGSRAEPRPWSERPQVKRRRTVPPEQEERWRRTRERVFTAFTSIREYALPAAHDALEMSTEALRFAPVAGLAECARVLLTIWDSLQLVETNRLACLRLTERCADILLSVYEEIHEADRNAEDGADKVGEELSVPLAKLTDSFKAVHVLLQKQVHRPFLKRYLKRDDILKSVNACDVALSDALGMFSLSIQIRTLRQLQAAEARRRAETERIIASLSPSISPTPLPDVKAEVPQVAGGTKGSDAEKTPKPKFVELPPAEGDGAEPPPYETTSSGGTGRSIATATTAGTGTTSKTATTASSGAMGLRETVHSPPPTPDSDILLPPTQQTSDARSANASQHTLVPPPPDPSVIRQQLLALAAEQNAQDHAHDLADLRALMREAIATANDAEMISVLQVKRNEMPEALKTLQRALEKEQEREREESTGSNEFESSTEEVTEAFSDSEAKLKRRGSQMSALGLRGMPAIPGLTRRRTDASSKSKSSHAKSGNGRGTTSTKAASAVDDDSARGSGWSGYSTSTEGGRDTLDREFIETGIDALRRISLSKGQDLNLPNWTITRYEVDLDHLIGVGYFSDVYKAKWHGHTVAVKVLSPTTPSNLFIHEMTVWKSLPGHPNVLPLLGASSATGESPWFFVSPYLKNGNLVSYLRKMDMDRHGLGMEDTERRMVYEVAKGMQYLHRMGVMHGDLKGSNVLIDDNGHCVISDFGQSEMKNEAFRLSGTTPPRGTLRWQAPEILRGQTSQHLTKESDVYAYAIVCVEIFQHGALPWSTVDDDIIRRYVIDEDRRPSVPTTLVTKDLMPVVERCWVADPKKRSSFDSIVRDLKKRNRYTESPVVKPKIELYEEGRAMRGSPKLTPKKIENLGVSIEVSSTGSSPASTPPVTYATLSPGTIPVQRIITPIREEEKSSTNSPITERKTFDVPGRSPPPSESFTSPHIKMDDVKKNNRAGPSRGASESSTTNSSRTGSTDNKTSGADVREPGLELRRVQSPPPADEIAAQRKNERRYRLCLVHDFNPSLKLPLWEPSPVELGAVGYLSRPSGTFVTLFNSFNPQKTSSGTCEGMPSLYGYGTVSKGSQRIMRRSAAQRGLDIIQGLLWFRSRSTGDFQQNVTRRVSFPIRAGQKSAYLYVESTMYRYVDSEDLAVPKAWFTANIPRILELYGREHHLQKEDVYLVVGALSAPDYALFVNHNNPDGQVHFNVYAPQKAGQDWGTFSIDTESTARSETAVGPVYHDDVQGKHASANKVSKVKQSGAWDTVLLARLRFPPDSDRPTSV